MKSQALSDFLQDVAADPVLQSRCGEVCDLAQLVELARELGYAITARELQLWAHDKSFAAPWWPWAGEGFASHTAFFQQ